MKLPSPPTSGGARSVRRRLERAFTFAEVLAAMVFMAIVIPVAMHGLQIANRAGVIAERKGAAVQLADRLLNESIVTGTWRNGGQSGTLRQDGKDFQWRLLQEAWSESGLRLVSVEVSYWVQNREYYVLLSTLVKEAI